MHLLLPPKHVGPSSCFLSCSVPFPLCPLDLSASSDPATALLHRWRPLDENLPPSLTTQLLCVALLHSELAMYPSSSPSALLSSEKVLSHSPFFRLPWRPLIVCRWQGWGRAGSSTISYQFSCNFQNSFPDSLQASHEGVHIFLEEADMQVYFLHLPALPLYYYFANRSYFSTCRTISFTLCIWTTIFFLSVLLTFLKIPETMCCSSHGGGCL